MSDRKLETILRREKIYHFEKDIRLLTREELAQRLASNKGKIPMTRLMKNIIWNAYEQIKEKEAEPIFGNLRTFWYMWVKPTLNHIEDDKKSKTDLYKVMLKMFSHLVLNKKLFHYSDFDFTDENWQNRWIGTKRPEILVFSEKTGWVRFMRELNEKLGVSSIALGGFPSALSSEYTVQHIHKAIGKNKKVHLIGIVDYDPSGDLISLAFKDQIEASGLPVASMTTLVKPENGYSEKEIEIFKFELPKFQKTKLKHWLKKTNGINGKAFGLESESMPKSRVWKAIETLVL